MPYMNTTTTVKLTDEKKESLAKRFGEAITVIPGKTEAHLMLGFNDEVPMYFGGETGKPMAFVEVKILGTSTKEYFTKLTAEICRHLEEELGISSECVYVEYVEATHWGWNGSNF